MKKAAKIAISLPQALLDTVEKERSATGETRSEFLRRALEAFFRHRRERELEEQYVKGYQQFPETAEEIAFSEALLQEAFAESPWEEEEQK